MSVHNREAENTPPAADQPEHLRNVALVGPSGAGKTTLVEYLLAATGIVDQPGGSEAGTTVSDRDRNDDSSAKAITTEMRPGRSTELSLTSLRYDAVKLNLLDTPGHPDFVGDLRAGLRAADATLFVVSAVDGVDAATQFLWEECAALGMPRAVVVTKLDNARADFDEMVAICQRLLGGESPGMGVAESAGLESGLLPLHLPLASDDGGIGGLINLLDSRIADYSTGQRTERAADPEHVSGIAAVRGTLLEAIFAESDNESLLERYLAGDDVELETSVPELESAIARGSLHPILAVSADARVGATEVLRLLTQAFPSPVERDQPIVTTVGGEPLTPPNCDTHSPLLAEVVKTTSAPTAGRSSLVRVFAGTLRPDTVVHVSGHFSSAAATATVVRGYEAHESDELIGAMSYPLGTKQRSAQFCIAGDICAVATLRRAETGDTLSDRQSPLLLQPWVLPEPLFPVGIVAHDKADEDKLSGALARLVAEDPSLRLTRDTEAGHASTRQVGAGQLVLWCMGEAHAEAVLHRLRHRYGVPADVSPLRVSLRETFGQTARGHGRDVTQSGELGQLAACDLEVDPLPCGSGLEFVNGLVGGAVPQQFISSIEKGVREQLRRGVVAGFPMTDVRVTLVASEAPADESSDAALQTAGALAVQNAAASGAVRLLEPVDELHITVADEYVGLVLSDIAARRGRVLGREAEGSGRTVVRAEVPATEVSRYAVDLRSLAHGTGTFTRRYTRHDPLPTSLATKFLRAS